MNKEVPTTDNTLHDMIKLSAEEIRPYDGFEGQWPGDGSGMSDLADYMALEDQGW
jgi:hypothetical protein